MTRISYRAPSTSTHRARCLKYKRPLLQSLDPSTSTCRTRRRRSTRSAFSSFARRTLSNLRIADLFRCAVNSLHELNLELKSYVSAFFLSLPRWKAALSKEVLEAFDKVLKAVGSSRSSSLSKVTESSHILGVLRPIFKLLALVACHTMCIIHLSLLFVS